MMEVSLKMYVSDAKGKEPSFTIFINYGSVDLIVRYILYQFIRIDFNIS